MRMTGLLAALVVGACVAAGPATKPSTRPAGVPEKPGTGTVADLRQWHADCGDYLAGAEGACLLGLGRGSDYKSAVADRESKMEALNEARANGTPQQKIDASAAYNRARAVVAKMQDDALADDPAVKQGKQAVEQSRKELAEAEYWAKRGEESRARAKTEADAEKSRPINQPRIGAVGKFSGPVRVIQIIDKDNLVGEYANQIIWFKGIATAGMVDGGRYDLKMSVKFSDTTKYGGSTVYLVEPAD